MYKVIESKVKFPTNRFFFELEGTEYSVPKAEFLSGRSLKVYEEIAGVDEENPQISDGTLLYKLFVAANRDLDEVIWDLDSEQLTGLFAGWMEASEDPGKISWVRRVVDAHPIEVEAECLRVALRLRDCGTETFTVGDLYALLTTAPRDGALAHAMHPEDARWGLTEQLLAGIIDQVNMYRWIDAGKPMGQQPQPIDRPGHRPQVDSAVTQVDSAEMTEIDAWLAERRAAGKL